MVWNIFGLSNISSVGRDKRLTVLESNINIKFIRRQCFPNIAFFVFGEIGEDGSCKVCGSLFYPKKIIPQSDFYRKFLL